MKKDKIFQMFLHLLSEYNMTKQFLFKAMCRDTNDLKNLFSKIGADRYISGTIGWDGEIYNEMHFMWCYLLYREFGDSILSLKVLYTLAYDEYLFKSSLSKKISKYFLEIMNKDDE